MFNDWHEYTEKPEAIYQPVLMYCPRGNLKMGNPQSLRHQETSKICLSKTPAVFDFRFVGVGNDRGNDSIARFPDCCDHDEMVI